ncbi:hypothetical protein S7335_4920 [Synechococcus sp. PCC 7335]|uniref:hypothetical protein n=1 Tax=Synechococcus sp. (strain ATCC 29403 / PCC 7335) TaxID=91464 RepID=UPI00017EB80E|nr:hypothetical protein [Synechococcus sp. PCC 7335]EDX87213.1 hypothetical protein S7335_4920 [Synechococcus sp. PCC 7335]
MILLSAGLCGIGLMTAAIAQIGSPSTIKQTPALDLQPRSPGDVRAIPAVPRSGALSSFPSLGSTVFDAQLAGYRSYLETIGTPDILIVGSSRSLQGIDPTELRYQLSLQGADDVKVYNFSVNGATAQVVNFVVSELLPGALPKMIVWGDGSRAFNDGRRDRTWESLIASPGYQAVQSGEKPTIANESEALTSDLEPGQALDLETMKTEPESDGQGLTDSKIRTGISTGEIDRFGFSAVSDRFNPVVYYQEFTNIQGQYDEAYSPFVLEGSQADALGQLATFLEQRGSHLFFVNLPLSDSYLDAYRLNYETQFQDFLVVQSDRYRFQVIDLLTQWLSQPELFADPSHINRYGAAVIGQELARNPNFLLTIGSTDAATTPR